MANREPGRIQRAILSVAVKAIETGCAMPRCDEIAKTMSLPPLEIQRVYAGLLRSGRIVAKNRKIREVRV